MAAPTITTFSPDKTVYVTGETITFTYDYSEDTTLAQVSKDGTVVDTLTEFSGTVGYTAGVPAVYSLTVSNEDGDATVTVPLGTYVGLAVGEIALTVTEHDEIKIEVTA